MATPLNIYLVRHALSQANIDNRVNLRLPDQRVPLATGQGHDGNYREIRDGHWQAQQAGRVLAEHLRNQAGPQECGKTRVLCSPYLRTRQTAATLRQELDAQGIVHDYREEIALREISFGLFDGYSPDELAVEFPREFAHYQKHLHIEGEGGASRDGEFWVPMPLGESRAQVADRVKGVFGTILRDAAPQRTDPVRNVIVVSHGVTIRTFLMQWLHHPFEWYGQQPNPANASIQVISAVNGRYQHSALFEGFTHQPDMLLRGT